MLPALRPVNPAPALLATLRHVLHDKPDALAANEAAFAAGRAAVAACA